MRISTSQIFSQSLRQINASLSDVSELNSMNSTQKRINRPSDDPAGMGRVVELRAYDETLSGYLNNCSVAGEYLSTADQALVQASEVISAALENAEQGATETYTTDQLRMLADEMSSYLDSLASIANTRMGSDSLFGGNDLESSAYEEGLGVTLTNESLEAADFVSVSGELDSSIYVRFDSAGDIGTDALDYRYSTDGGDTWTSATLAAGDTTLVLDDCEVELVAGTAVTEADDAYGGTEFIVRRAMQYMGSDEAMTVSISEGSAVAMTSVGSDIFGGVDAATGTAYGEPNLLEAIADCVAFLETGNFDGVADCLETIRAGLEDMEAGGANLGARETRISNTEQSLSLVQEMVNSSISGEEDADATQILVELEQANYVYEAVLSSSSDILKMSLLNYI